MAVITGQKNGQKTDNEEALIAGLHDTLNRLRSLLQERDAVDNLATDFTRNRSDQMPKRSNLMGGPDMGEGDELW